MHVGVDSFVPQVTDPATGHVVGPVERLEHLLEEIELADRVGLRSFGIGEHHTDLLRGIELLGTEVAPRVTSV